MTTNPFKTTLYRDACRSEKVPASRPKADTPDDALAHPETEANTPEAYRADETLQEAVDLAITLRRPLLLQGEPGCGKTRLAYHAAYRLGWPLETGYLKSTSRAQDMLYQYDAVARLYDAQLAKDGAASPHRNPADAQNYIRLGPLGRAIVRAKHGHVQNHPFRSIVLLDEIDKADLDFPNDLLRELDRMEFTVGETGVTHGAGRDKSHWPLVIVTHNEEKALPSAFLRRCIFHFLTFPQTEEELFAIVSRHGESWGIGDEGMADLARGAIRVVQALRGVDGLSKKPGLSELLDWILWLHHRKWQGAPLDTLPYAELPAPGVLLKSKSDWDTARSYVPPTAPEPPR